MHMNMNFDMEFFSPQPTQPSGPYPEPQGASPTFAEASRQIDQAAWYDARLDENCTNEDRLQFLLTHATSGHHTAPKTALTMRDLWEEEKGGPRVSNTEADRLKFVEHVTQFAQLVNNPDVDRFEVAENFDVDLDAEIEDWNDGASLLDIANGNTRQHNDVTTAGKKKKKHQDPGPVTNEMLDLDTMKLLLKKDANAATFYVRLMTAGHRDTIERVRDLLNEDINKLFGKEARRTLELGYQKAIGEDERVWRIDRLMERGVTMLIKNDVAGLTDEWVRRLKKRVEFVMSLILQEEDEGCLQRHISRAGIQMRRISDANDSVQHRLGYELIAFGLGALLQVCLKSFRHDGLAREWFGPDHGMRGELLDIVEIAVHLVRWKFQPAVLIHVPEFRELLRICLYMIAGTCVQGQREQLMEEMLAKFPRFFDLNGERDAAVARALGSIMKRNPFLADYMFIRCDQGSRVGDEVRVMILEHLAAEEMYECARRDCGIYAQWNAAFRTLDQRKPELVRRKLDMAPRPTHNQGSQMDLDA